MVNKSQVKDREEAIRVNENVIEKVDKFKYLGWWIESSLQNREHMKSRKQALLAAASKLRKLGINSHKMSMEVKAFLFDTYCRAATQYGLVNSALTQKDIMELSTLEGKIIKVAFGMTKYHSTSSLLNAIKIKPLDELLKIRKLQHFIQLTKFEITSDILQKQIDKKIPLNNKSLLKSVLTITGQTDRINDLETLTTSVLAQITEIEEKICKNENTELSKAVRYLLENNSSTNHAVVKKLLNWENRSNLLAHKRNEHVHLAARKNRLNEPRTPRAARSSEYPEAQLVAHWPNLN